MFLKLTAKTLWQIGVRAKLNPKVSKENILSIFIPQKLNNLMRMGPGKPNKSLLLANEFFRTDGVHAQFVCGVLKVDGVPVSAGDGEGEDDLAANDGGTGATDEDDEDIQEPDDAAERVCPADISNLFACDPGKENLYTVLRARLVKQNERKGLVPLEDGRFIVWDKVLAMSKGHFDQMRGTTKRRLQRKKKIKSTGMQGYRAALAALSTIPLSCDNPTLLRARILVHFKNHATIQAYEGSKQVARMSFDAFMSKQSTFAKIANSFENLLGEKGVCAWGGARWAVTAKGSSACASAMVFRYLVKQPWAKTPDTNLSRFPLERETNTSCKCSNCLGPNKMVHPRHKTVYCKEWLPPDPLNPFKRKRQRVRRMPPGGGSVYGLYQCQNTSCYRTWDRDLNGASNIGRCFYDRAHGSPRHPTLCSIAELNRLYPPPPQQQQEMGDQKEQKEEKHQPMSD